MSYLRDESVLPPREDLDALERVLDGGWCFFGSRHAFYSSSFLTAWFVKTIRGLSRFTL